MNKIKNAVLIMFSIIGFVVILSSFKQKEVNSQNETNLNQSHVWEVSLSDNHAYLYNKVTGEVRQLTSNNNNSAKYKVMTEKTK